MDPDSPVKRDDDIYDKKQEYPDKSSVKSHAHKIQPHHHHISLLLILVILLVIVLLAVIKPALLGYKLSTKFNEIKLEASEFIKELDMTKSELIITQTNLESCKSLTKDYLNKLSEEKNLSFQCSYEKDELESRYRQLKTEYDFNISKIKSEFEQKGKEIQINLTQVQSEYDSLKSIYDIVVDNSVYSICCKEKVDNKDIDSYIISNGKIICASGEKDKIIC